MTEQVPEKLENCHPHVTFGDLQPRRVVRSDPQKFFSWYRDYRFKVKPIPRYQSTCCYRGYIAEFELTPQGLLVLRSYLYPSYAEQKNPDRTNVNEILEGDFWLVMQTRSEAPEVYIPFRSGRIIEDDSFWGVERNLPLASVKYPERYDWYVEEMAPHVRLGAVVNVRVDEHSDEWVIVTCSDDFPASYARAKFLRNGFEICEQEIVGSGDGGWLVETPVGACILRDDEIWATGKWETKLLPEGSHR